MPPANNRRRARNGEPANLLSPHDQVWSEIEEKAVETQGVYTRSAAINWPPHLQHIPFQERKPIDYFYLMHPNNWHKMRDCTNVSILNEEDKVTVGQLQTWLGVWFAMCLDPTRGDRGDYWKTKPDNESVLTHRNFGSRFKITKNRFEMITKNFQLEGPRPEGNIDEFFQVRQFVEDFNRHRLQVVNPGPTIVIDECMSYYEGMNSKYSANGCPGLTKIIRKPLGIGIELKAACDGDTNCLMKLEIQEGALPMRVKEYHDQFGYSTAVTLRLTKPWHGSGRTVIGDSAFGSLKTCVQLANRGLFSQMMVKQCHVGFPKRYFEIWHDTNYERQNRGIHKLLETSYEGITANGEVVNKKMYGLAWADKKCKMIIFNKGTTNAGNPSVRWRHRKQVNNQGNNI